MSVEEDDQALSLDGLSSKSLSTRSMTVLCQSALAVCVGSEVEDEVPLNEVTEDQFEVVREETVEVVLIAAKGLLPALPVLDELAALAAAPALRPALGADTRRLLTGARLFKDEMTSLKRMSL